MKYLESFVHEYNTRYVKKDEVFEEGISGKIKKIRSLLLDDKFLPSNSLKNLFDKLLRRSQYPMEVAITGQFSSGKSTFLNALLSKDILPTGITPVTSKVNFINYAKEYKLRVTYMNGAQEYHAIESISKFTDQREDEIDNIKYLSIYAPMEILKDISFVDTPGLNSQSLVDTQTTQKVLRDVDGIIWLSLIDNAGKESEAEILKEYMQHFKEKSLCVLNQKDKFSKEEVNKTSEYVSSKFSEYFQKVVAISAKQALDSRSQQKEVLIQEQMHSISENFKQTLSGREHGLDFFKETFSEYEENVREIKNTDRSKDAQILHESNIEEVLDYIQEVIRPAALESKAYALEKDLQNICDILIKEYESIFSVYESLQDIIKTKQEEVLNAFDEITSSKQKTLSQIYAFSDAILIEVANEISLHIKSKSKQRYEHSTGSFLHFEKIEAHEYETFFIDNDALYKKLFYDDEHIDKKFVKLQEQLKSAEVDISKSFKEVYALLEDAVHTWQEPYELISKQREISSDLEFSKTRNFASKVYENILIDYHSGIEGNISAFKKKFSYLNGALTLSYKPLIRSSVLHFENSFSKQSLLYENDPRKVSLNIPQVEDIYAHLKEDFSFSKVEVFLNSRRNYLYKIVSYAKEEYVQINKDKIAFLEKQKDTYRNKIDAIGTIKKEIVN